MCCTGLGFDLKKYLSEDRKKVNQESSRYSCRQMKKKVRDNYLGFNDMSFSLSYFSPKNSYFPFIIDFYSSFLQIGYGQPVLTFC